jgi:hypothetical protein
MFAQSRLIDDRDKPSAVSVDDREQIGELAALVLLVPTDNKRGFADHLCHAHARVKRQAQGQRAGGIAQTETKQELFRAGDPMQIDRCHGNDDVSQIRAKGPGKHPEGRKLSRVQ